MDLGSGVLKTSEICHQEDASAMTKLTKKGVKSLNEAKDKLKRQDINVEIGDNVHADCYRDFRRDSTRNKVSGSTASEDSKTPSPAKRRSSVTNYNCRTDCFYCTSEITQREINTDQISVVLTVDINEGVRKTIKRRENDRWAVEVEGRLEDIRCMRAKDCRYHHICDSNFRTGKDIPIKYSIERRSCKKVKMHKRGKHGGGRPKLSDLEKAFQLTEEELLAAENESMTVKDLQEKMVVHLKSLKSNRRPYTTKHIKGLLKAKFKDKLFFTHLPGRKSIVVFRQLAENILYDFHQAKSESEIDEKRRILRSVGKLCKAAIYNFVDDTDNYPPPEDIADAEKMYGYVLEEIRIVLDEVLGDKILVKASLGQALMQNARPRAIQCPLQVAYGVQNHLLTGSRLHAEQSHALGFQASYHDVLTFEKSAAVCQAGGLPAEFDPKIHTLNLHGDNADSQIQTLDGFGQLHSMGMMASISPGIDMAKSRRIKKKINITYEDLKAVSKVEIHLSDYDGTNPGLAYKPVDIPSPLVNRATFYNNLYLMHDFAWTFNNPEIPLFSGFMSQVHNNNSFGSSIDTRNDKERSPSSFIFLPFINMDPTDPTCIESTLCYFACYCQFYG